MVGVARDQRRDLWVVANVTQQPFPPSRAALVGQCSIFRVGTGIDPLFQALAARPFERRLLQFPVLEGNHAPSAGRKNIVEAAEHAVRRRCIQGLAIIVDDRSEEHTSELQSLMSISYAV